MILESQDAKILDLLYSRYHPMVESSSNRPTIAPDISFAMCVYIRLGTPVDRCPFWLILEKTNSFDVLRTVSLPWRRLATTYIARIRGEAMVDTRRQDEQVVLLTPYPHPLVPFAPDVEEALAVKNVPDLPSRHLVNLSPSPNLQPNQQKERSPHFFIFMQMFLLKHLHLLLIHSPHLLWRDSNLVPILVVALLSDQIHGIDRRAIVVDNSEIG